ncbi:MAG: aminotransferase class I/II-fold pyridoxal phosphate-dependent enzyme [Elusimicrobia bacterium]|nr:aminotransferase class I/II-fold pyridoxal phosphate-dependent enzyme [Elusimicrobiota bacterium]
MTVIPYARQRIEEEDISSVVATLRSDFLTTGPRVEEFENALKGPTGSPFVVVVSSGTAALHLALLAGGIGPGDEVLVPTLSFAATANAVCYVGARPVFVDCLKGEFLMDPEDADRKITPRTRAIIPVHFAGHPAPMGDINVLASRHRLTVIEDGAHALGAQWHGHPVGSLSPFTIFSFHPVKHITTGEGGAVAVSDVTLMKRLKQLRHHGIDLDSITRNVQKRWEYDMVELGYNYRLSDIQCALGVSQLKKLPKILKARKRLADRYDRLLQGCHGLILPPRPDPLSTHAWHLYVVRIVGPFNNGGEKRDRIFNELRFHGIQTNVHYKPIHLHSYYGRLGWKMGDCPEAERIFPQLLTLPLYWGMTEQQQDEVVDHFLKAMNEDVPREKHS